MPDIIDIDADDLSEDSTNKLDIDAEDLLSDDSSPGKIVVQNFPEPRRIQIIYCSKCGEGNQLGNQYCSSCGKKVSVAEASNVKSRFFGRLFSYGALTKAVFGLVVVLFIFAAVFSVIFILQDDEKVFYVPGDFDSIQEAIEASSDGYEIIVSEGIYRENLNFNGKNIVVRSEHPEDWVKIANTVIDGNRRGPVVVFKNGESEEAVLKGFTIMGGSGYALSLERSHGYYGGGICIFEGSFPRIEFNIVKNNIADFGGGISIINSSPKLFKNNINNNKATINGGGLFVDDISSPVIEKNSIDYNEALEGGAVYFLDGAVFSSDFVNSNSILTRNQPNDF